MEKSYDVIKNIEQFQEVINKEYAVLFYFSHEKCNVCKVLKPKVAEMIETKFPKVKKYYVDTVKTPEIAGQNSVFAVPTIITYMGGREYFRRSRNIGLGELSELIGRPYEMIFEDE